MIVKWHGLRSIIIGGAVVAFLLGLPALAQSEGEARLEAMEPATDEVLENPDAADWPMYRRTYNGWGYSPLEQITTDNVTDLDLVWSRAMDPGVNEVTPLVYDGIMFLPHPGDTIQAIDAVTGDLIWEYRRQIPEEAYGLGERKRSIALYGDNIYVATWDNFIVALDARTGQVEWETQRSGELSVSNSTGPIVANGVVLTGSTCAYTYPGGCYAAGYDAESGEELWLNYAAPREGEEGEETWGGVPLEGRIHTGVWGALTYDPELDLVYYGSSSTAPSSPTLRGSGLHDTAPLAGTNTRYAVDRQTGEIRWQKQIMPAAYWDQECTFEAIIAEVALNPNPEAEGMHTVGPNGASGETRKVTTGVPCKTGTIWTLDAETGEYYWAKDTTYQNMYTSIDEQGNVQINPDTILQEPGQSYFVCPTFAGGRDWAPVALNPNSNVMFIPLNNLCADMVAFEDEPPVTSYQVDSTYRLPPENDGNVGRIDAVSIETGETLWSYEQRAPNYSPVMATGGGLVFSGDQGRYFRAHDQETGELLWQTRLPSEVSGHAITYEVDGRQYVAIPVGATGSGPGIAEFTADVDAVTGSNAVYVFALPE